MLFSIPLARESSFGLFLSSSSSLSSLSHRVEQSSWLGVDRCRRCRSLLAAPSTTGRIKLYRYLVYCCYFLAWRRHPVAGFSIIRQSLAAPYATQAFHRRDYFSTLPTTISLKQHSLFRQTKATDTTSKSKMATSDNEDEKVDVQAATRRSPRRKATQKPVADDVASKATSPSKVEGATKKGAKTKPLAVPKKTAVESDSESSSQVKASPLKKKRVALKKQAVDTSSSEKETKLPSTKAPKKKAASKKRSGSESDAEDSNSPPKKKKAPAHQVLTERDNIPKLWDASEHTDSYTFKIASWNVAGLRAVVKKDPDAIGNLIQKLNLDVLCLQETKLQESHLDDPKVTLPTVEGYEAFYSCSMAKKGYSGTAAFIRKRGKSKQKGKQTTMDAFVKSSIKTKEQEAGEGDLPVDVKYLVPDEVSLKMGVDKHDQEGRIIVMDFPLFTAVNVYVPNSGQKLERLAYRTAEWDKDLLGFMQAKQKNRGVPVLWLGDLNVAHTNLEVWNDGAKHLPKQAGVTPEERASFQAQLDAGFIDAFRKLHPDAKGHYSYWSQRAGNRAPNKGLRLDYFICDPDFFAEEKSQVVIRDSYMVESQEGSDHCPVVLEIEIKK